MVGFKTTNSGTNRNDINGGMNISQQYRIGHALSPTILITGHQDNGTNLLMGTGWSAMAATEWIALLIGVLIVQWCLPFMRRFLQVANSGVN